MHETEHRSFGQPDEIREFPNGRAEIVKVGGGEVGRLIFQPGWRWSNDVKPMAQTASCEAPHFQYHVSGQLAIRMGDGTEFIAGPGDITSLPSGHDAWVVGDEQVVVVDWFGASNYAKSSPPRRASEIAMTTGQSSPTAVPTTRDVIERFNEAFNRHDADALAPLLTDDTVFEDTSPAPDGQRIEGKAAVVAFWRVWFTH